MFKPGDYVVWMMNGNPSPVIDVVFTTDKQGNPLICSCCVWYKEIYLGKNPPIYELVTDIFREENLIVRHGIITYKGYKKS